MWRRIFLGLFLTFGIGAMVYAMDETISPVSFDDLPGWAADDHKAAFDVFIKSCSAEKGKRQLDDEVWKPICKFAKTNPNPRAFFELMFQPVIIGADKDTLFTGYYEPEINGALSRGGPFQTPIYQKPPELVEGQLWKSRAEIMDGALNGRGLEIAWLEDPVEAFFLQIQGSGRIALPDGSALRVGYAAKNGHKYRSLGQEMERRGLLPKNKLSAGNIKAWVRKNPTLGRELLKHNGSYVFFRKLKSLRDDEGPLGALGLSVTTMRTIAVDPRYNPLGMPVYIDKGGRDPIQRLMIAQDIGSAIKGAQRADIFYGTGKDAGRIAGRIKDGGRMYTFLPIVSAKRLGAWKDTE
ncbi:MAG: MltA domain-containing protein [Pseudomonadota bacterium]